MKHFLLLSFLLSTILGYSQNISGSELLEKTIKFHDPENKWSNSNLRILLSGTSPKRKEARKSDVQINNIDGSFKLSKNEDGKKIESGVISGECFAKIDGKDNVDKKLEEKYRISCKSTKWIKDYYCYLYGLPMKLKDPGTIIDPEVKTTNFQGKDYFTLKVTYESEVGHDTWFFYIDKSTYAMEGYKFYHNDKPDGGEYITLKGLTEVGGMKIPKTRSWYYNKGDGFLGTDDIIEAEILK